MKGHPLSRKATAKAKPTGSPPKGARFEIKPPQSVAGWFVLAIVGFAGMLVLGFVIVDWASRNLIETICVSIWAVLDWIWNALVALMGATM